MSGSGSLLLTNQDYKSIEFSTGPTDLITSNFTLLPEIKKSNFKTIKHGGQHTGDLITKFNEYYFLDRFPETAHIILPNNPLPGNFIWIIYDHMSTIDFVSKDADWFPKFKVKSYKQKIMGHNEVVIIDVPFHKLQIVYHSEAQGWLIC